MRRLPTVAALAAIALLASCSGQARPVVALDEAFTASRPALALLLNQGWGLGSFPFGLFASPAISSVKLTEGAGKALDAAMAERKRSGKPGALITSPLIAKALVGGGAWSGDPPILVPEWHSAAVPSEAMPSEAVPGAAVPGEAVPGLWIAVSDPIPAYRAAGSAAGSYLAALAGEGGSPSCGFLYSESPSRPRAALNAFAAAYAEASEGMPLYVRELGEAGQSASSPEKSPPPPAGSAAEAAVAELLGSDIRLLFIALGPDSIAAIRAAARPGLAVGADFPYPEPPPSLAFRIVPDDYGLARALVSEYRALRGGSKAGETRYVPSLLEVGAPAAAIRAGRLDLKGFLGNAALRAKGTR
jgi:hypothetical protein